MQSYVITASKNEHPRPDKLVALYYYSPRFLWTLRRFAFLPRPPRKFSEVACQDNPGARGLVLWSFQEYSSSCMSTKYTHAMIFLGIWSTTIDLKNVPFQLIHQRTRQQRTISLELACPYDIIGYACMRHMNGFYWLQDLLYTWRHLHSLYAENPNTTFIY